MKFCVNNYSGYERGYWTKCFLNGLHKFSLKLLLLIEIITKAQTNIFFSMLKRNIIRSSIWFEHRKNWDIIPSIISTPKRLGV